MRLDGYQRFLQKEVFDLDNMGVYYFLGYRTSPQAILRFRAFNEHSKGGRAASG